MNVAKQSPNVKYLPLNHALICFAIIGCSYVVNAMDRQVFSLLLPKVMQVYSFPLNTGGLLVTIFTLGIGLAGIPAAYLMDRWSRRTVMMISITIFSVFTVLTAYAHGFTDMLLYRSLTGVGEGMQVAALYAATGAYFHKYRGLVFGILSALFGVGNFVGSLFGGLLLQAYDWQVPLLVFGAAGFVFVALILFVPKDFTEHRDQPREATADAGAGKVWNRSMVLLAVTAVTFGIYQYGYIGLYPTFLARTLQYPPSAIGFTMSMFGIGAMMAVVTGYLGDKFSQKWIIVIAMICCAATGYALFNLAATPIHHAVLSFVVGVTGGAVIANISSLMQRRVAPAHIGKASGIFVATVYLPASVSGYILGTLVSSFGWGVAALIQLALLPMIGAAALLFLPETGRAMNAGRIVPRPSDSAA